MTGQETLAVVGAVGAALFGGMMLAFSNFVMRAFGRVPAPEAIRAMQSINRAVINPLFLVLFLGPGLVGVVGVLVGLWAGQLELAWALGAALYGGGVVAVTVGGSVPLNDRLEAVDADRPDAETAWRRYAVPWVRYNTLRSIAAVLAATAFVVALA